MPTHSKWNHSTAHSGLSHPTCGLGVHAAKIVGKDGRWGVELDGFDAHHVTEAWSAARAVSAPGVPPRQRPPTLALEPAAAGHVRRHERPDARHVAVAREQRHDSAQPRVTTSRPLPRSGIEQRRGHWHGKHLPPRRRSLQLLQPVAHRLVEARRRRADSHAPPLRLRRRLTTPVVALAAVLVVDPHLMSAGAAGEMG